MKNPWTIIGLITVILFGGAIWFSSSVNEINNEGVEVVDKIKGNPDAAVTLVEYSDFQCPACGAFHPVVKELLDTYGDQIRFEYKHFPLVAAHPYATQAAVAAEAAGQQDKFFEFHDLLFENQSAWSSSRTPGALFIKYAEELELDIELFRRHMNSTLLSDRVRAQFTEGREIEVRSTPSFFLNGEYMNPSDFGTYEGFMTAVTAAINPDSAQDTVVVPEVKFGI